jgi:hypothetical protein
MQRNPYWPLNGPSFFAMLKFRRGVFSPHKSRRRLRTKFRGADGKPTTEHSRETGFQTGYACCSFKHCRALVRHQHSFETISERSNASAATAMVSAAFDDSPDAGIKKLGSERSTMPRQLSGSDEKYLLTIASFAASPCETCITKKPSVPGSLAASFFNCRDAF